MVSLSTIPRFHDPTVSPSHRPTAPPPHRPRRALLSFTSCFHTYLRFDDTAPLELHGLGGASFVDKCDGNKIKTQDADVITLEAESARSGTDAGKAGFVDRIYLGTAAAQKCETEVKDSRTGATLYVIEQSNGWPCTTVYNPCTGDKLGGAAAGLDFDEDGYQHMLCVEPTVADVAPQSDGRAGATPVSLGPGMSWSGAQKLCVGPPADEDEEEDEPERGVILHPLNEPGKGGFVYNAAQTHNGVVYASGQVAVQVLGANGSGADVTTEAKHCMANLIDVLHKSGSDVSKIMRTTCLLGDISMYAEFNAAYIEYFPDPATRPARVW